MKHELFIERLKQTEENVWAWVPEHEEFDLTKDFSINEENLSAEICRMGMLLVRYGTVAGEVAANKERKEEERRLIRAQLDGAIRSQAEANNIKLSEVRIKEQIVASQTYQDALTPLHTLRADAIKTDHWYRSISKKSDLLNALAFRQSAELKKAY